MTEILKAFFYTFILSLFVVVMAIAVSFIHSDYVIYAVLTTLLIGFAFIYYRALVKPSRETL